MVAESADALTCQILQLINRPATSQPNGDKQSKPIKRPGRLDVSCLDQTVTHTVDTKPNLGNDNPDEWGEFLHLPNQKFHDFNKIREEIVKDTEKMTGKNAGEIPYWVQIARKEVTRLTTLTGLRSNQESRRNLSICVSSRQTCSPLPWSTCRV
jgi:hypothetical protein